MRLIAVLAALVACAAFGVMASAARAATDTDTLSVSATNSTETQVIGAATAGATNEGYQENLGFTYANDTGNDETVQKMTLDLPLGTLNALAALPTSSLCTSAQLATYTSASGCPTTGEIGTLSGSANIPLLSGSAAALGGTLYLMSPASSSSIADLGIEVWSLTPSVHSIYEEAPISLQLNSAGQPYLQVVVTLPPTAVVSGLGNVAYSLTQLTQTINASTQAGVAFTYMPSASGSAVASVTTTMQYNGANSTTAGQAVSGETGSGSGNLAVSAASPAQPYSPTVAETVTKDSSDNNIGLVTTITQPAGQAPSQQEKLVFPSNLVPNAANAAADLCNVTDTPGTTTANAYSGCFAIGTVSASSPLVQGTETGNVYLTGSNPLQPDLTLVFNSPAAFSNLVINGSITLPTNSVPTTLVDFATVPDLALPNLTVTINGGAKSPFQTNCSTASGTVNAAFTGQNGATASSSAPFTISNYGSCSGNNGGTTVSSTPVASTSLSGLTGSHPKPTVKVKVSDKASKITTLTIAAPHGISFVNSKKLSKYVSVSGGSVKSVKVSGGNLVITLKSASSSVSVSIKTQALKESSSLAKSLKKASKKHPVKLNTKVSVKLASGKSASTTVTTSVS